MREQALYERRYPSGLLQFFGVLAYVERKARTASADEDCVKRPSYLAECLTASSIARPFTMSAPIREATAAATAP